MTDSIETRVARGAALLDERLPGWHERIDLDRLDLASTCDCILGQEFDGHSDADPDEDGQTPYAVGVHELFADLGDPEQIVRASIRHGFNAAGRGNDNEFRDLADEWQRVILARRGAQEAGR